MLEVKSSPYISDINMVSNFPFLKVYEFPDAEKSRKNGENIIVSLP